MVTDTTAPRAYRRTSQDVPTCTPQTKRRKWRRCCRHSLQQMAQNSARDAIQITARRTR